MTTRHKTGSKADRDALRAEMTAAGATLAAVATEMRTRWGMRPREAFRQAHGLSLGEAADRMNRAAEDSETTAFTDASQMGKWEKWPAPASRRPTLAVLALMGEVYGCTVEDLLDLEDRRHLPEADLRVLRHTAAPAADAPATPASPEPEPRKLPQEPVVAAAAESASWAQWAETSNVGDIALEQIIADVRHLATEYLTSDPVTLFARTRALRDKVFALLEGRQPPRQATDLYVAAGYLCALLSWMSSDLGNLTAADTQGRTAWLCAELAGHDGLRAWVLSTRCKIAYWDGRYRDAVNYARRGLTFTVPGTAGLLLACQESDAWAELGAVDEAKGALARADTARDQLAGSDDIGGLFSCSPVRYANYVSGVHLRTGQAVEALAEADAALGLVASQPVRAYGTEAQIHISRAVAHLTIGAADGALDALGPVLALRPEQRYDTITRRLQGMAASVARSALAGSGAARVLQGEVEVYCRESAPKVALSPVGAIPGWITDHD